MEQDEVRRCRRCGGAAVLLERSWPHRTMGLRSGQVTRELRCQACRARITSRSRARLIGYGIGGAMLCIGCVGLPLLGWVWWAWMQEAWHPAVVGAPPVARRFDPEPPRQRCSTCGGVARATQITAHNAHGLPTGTDFVYTCGQRQRSFTIESPWGTIFSVCAGLLVLLVGVAGLATANPLGLCCAALSLFAFGQAGLRLLRRLHNPELPSPPPTSP